MFKEQNIKLRWPFEQNEFNRSKGPGKSECSKSKTSNYNGILNKLNSISQNAQAKVNVQTAKRQITLAFCMMEFKMSRNIK